MLIFLAFLFLLTPFPTHQASIGERKNSTKTALHTISTLNTKPKTPALSPALKTSNASQTLFSTTTTSPETPSIKKTSKDKPLSSSPIKVVITEGCIQKEPQKDTVNSSKVQEKELSLKPGSPLVMTHHINLVPGSCTGGCEAEMAALKDRLETLEKEMSALKKQCILCSGVQCPNNCNKNGKCVSGKCVCQAGFTGVDCSKGFNKETKVSSDSSTSKKEKPTLEQSKANTTIIKGKNKEDQASGPATVKKLLLKKDSPVIHNVTQSTDKKTSTMLKANQKATTGNKKMETRLNVTVSTKQDKKLNQGDAILLKETSVEKTKLVKHLNLTNSTEKDGKNQSHVTLAKEKSSEMKNATTSSEFSRRKLGTGKETKTPKLTQVQKTETVQKHVNITCLTEKDNKSQQGNVTLLKDESSRKTKQDSHHSGTVLCKKEKKSNETKVLKDVTAEKKVAVGKKLNVTTFIEKDKSWYKTNTTVIKEGTYQREKISHVNVRKTSEKGKKFLQGDETTTVTKVLPVTEEKVNVTATTSAKDKSLHLNVKEDKSSKINVTSSHNITSTGFVITWEALGIFRNFTVTRKEVWSERRGEDDAEEAEKKQDSDVKADEFMSWNRTSPKVKSAERFSQILAGSARSYHFRNLRPERKYLVSLSSSGPHVRSKVHRLFVSTGPEPPTDLLFSNITETSLALFWTKPKSTVTGFKVIYTNTVNGLTGSMSVDSQLSHVLIANLSAGSRYDISVRSVIGAIESEATTASVVTVPDPPTDLQAVNVTDSKALLVWKPAQAKVHHYILTYGSTRLPNVTVTVMLSGTSVEHQLRGLHRSTLYAVKIMSQINSLQSSSVSLSSRQKAEVILNPTVSQYELTDLKASSHYTVKVDGESEGQYISVVSTAFKTAQVPYLYPADCSQVQLNGMKKSGEAEIYPLGKDEETVWVYCDMETDGGGWTVFQRRMDGSTDFFRDWKDYSKGFGEMSAEFWLGNDILHTLTSMEPMSLRVDLRVGNDTVYAHYSNFSVGSEVDHYTIDVSGYFGTAGDSMRYHNGCPFSTKDKDPSNNNVQCAKEYMGGWWYKNCYKANLNGVYATFSKDQGVVWIDWKGKDISLPFTEMKLRPASLSHMTPNTQG
ncbi:Tenascin [Bagarius yarrelli]|uniref:Tenascin n=1 Tax=Bagarius yarrelli TaxID=175774 RepID=A0A556VAP4_BAGYA|nr:Tenascin [Bagarius yarrelli]